MSGHFFVLLFMLSVSPFCVCVCRFCRCLKVWCSATILLKRVLVWVWKTSEDGDALVSLCVLSASLCWKIFLFSCVKQNNIIFLFFFVGCCHLLQTVCLVTVVSLLGGHFFYSPIFETSVYVTKKRVCHELMIHPLILWWFNLRKWRSCFSFCR